jgi:CheY-like chemotaxis protein
VKPGDGVTTPEEVLRVIQVNENAPRCPSCQQEVEDRFSVCPHCSAQLRANCPGCGKQMNPQWISCPYCGSAVTPAEAEASAPPAPVPAQPAARPPTARAVTRTFKALVVDDDPDLRRIVRVMIERSDLGLNVITAQDGQEALTLADIERPDVVILDLSMPGLDGFEVCRRLREDTRTKTVPVLMLTRGFQEGTDDYVIKPFRPEDLLARLRRMIERAYGPAAAVTPAAGAAA